LAYGDKDDIRAQTGLTTSNVSDADLDLIIASADRIIDGLAGVSMGTSLKQEASNALSAFFALSNVAGKLAMSEMSYTIVGAIKVDKRSASTLRTGLAKTFFDKFEFIIAQAPDTGLIEKVE